MSEWTLRWASKYRKKEEKNCFYTHFIFSFLHSFLFLIHSSLFLSSWWKNDTKNTFFFVHVTFLNCWLCSLGFANHFLIFLFNFLYQFLFIKSNDFHFVFLFSFGFFIYLKLFSFNIHVQMDQTMGQTKWKKKLSHFQRIIKVGQQQMLKMKMKQNLMNDSMRLSIVIRWFIIHFVTFRNMFLLIIHR